MTVIPPGALDVTALGRWMAGNAGADGSAPPDIELAPGGRSNLTFFVSRGERQWVLRRPPLGPVLPSAHDLRREHRVLRALRETDVPVPGVHAFCADDAVIGPELIDRAIAVDAGALAGLPHRALRGSA
ncbi:MAG TPA: phosphotransferase [Mycobacteriales bacterium]|nr:phosphotransferase [Mycobacteriales bacterium]